MTLSDYDIHTENKVEKDESCYMDFSLQTGIASRINSILMISSHIEQAEKVSVTVC